METNFTKGNWRIGLRNELVIVSDRKDGTKPTIAACQNSLSISLEEAKSNAKLIAAAPKILYYAKKVMETLEKHGGVIVPHLLDTDDNDGEKLR
jgi:hypothetical protein